MSSDSIRKYYQLYENRGSTSLYAAPWWLDAACGKGSWDAVLSYDAEGKIKTGLPYHNTKIRGMSAIITPPLTQFVSMIADREHPDSFDTSLLHALPKAPILDLSIKPTNITPFEDAAFPVHVRYSFIISPATEIAIIRNKYNEGLKRNLRQAEANYKIEESNDIPIFLELCRSTYLQRNMKAPTWLDETTMKVYNGLKEHQCGTITVALWQNKIIAGILTAWDHEATYYLAGGRTGDDSGASAHALLLDHAIVDAQARGLAFDFEGSMHQGIANFFQSFGGVPASFWQIRKFRGLGKLWSLFH